MFAKITFSPADLSFGLNEGDLEHWWGSCKARFVDYETGYPLRGDVTFLDGLPPELRILPRIEGKLNDTAMQGGMDERVTALRAQGYDQPDLLLLRYFPASEKHESFLGISVILGTHGLAFFKDAFHRLFPSSDVEFLLQCDFHGFREPHFDHENLPTKDQFMKGSPYFVTGKYSVSIRARAPSSE